MAIEKTKSSHLNETQINVLSLIEQRFYETGYIPTNEVVALDLELSLKEVEACWHNDSFKSAIVARGIDFRPDDSKKVLDPKQVVLANMLLNTHDKTTERQKLKLLGVTSVQYTAWLRQPAFRDYLKKRAEELFKASDHKAYAALIKSLDANDLNAVKFYFEMRGVYNPKLHIDVNIDSVVMRIIEVVSRHVDPDTMARIAEELDSSVETLKGRKDDLALEATSRIVENQKISEGVRL